MRILDKKVDFYDYLQNVYFDTSVTFDRTDSFIVTKKIMCDHLGYYRSYDRDEAAHPFLLLQVCNTFWLFLVEIIEFDEYGHPTKYKCELLETWKNYRKKRELIAFDFIEFSLDMRRYIGKEKNFWNWHRDNNKAKKFKKALLDAINADDFTVKSCVDEHENSYGWNDVNVKRHIPLLIACGISDFIDPLSIYLSFEEYFSLEKQSNERTESIGITDKDKIEIHGFDTKTSFRGKRTRRNL